MAFPSPTPTAKQLKEHLQEQQEPFTLNIFLSERGYLVKCLSSNGRNACCKTNLFKNLNKKMMLLSTRVVKSIDSILYKLVSSANVDELSSCCSDTNAHDRDEFQTAEILPYGFGEVIKGIVTPLGASSMSPNLGDVKPQKAPTDHDKYLNLMSMLDKISSDRVHHIITRPEIPSSGKGGSFSFIFTPFPWKLLGKSLMERYTLIGPSCSPQFQTNYEHVNQREEKSIKNEDKKKKIRNKYNYIYWFIGVEKLGNIIRAQQIYYSISGDDSSMDLSDTLEEWNYGQKLQRKIRFELGDTIMDDIVEETVIHLLRYVV